MSTAKPQESGFHQEIRSKKPFWVSSRKYCLDIDVIYYLTRTVIDRLAKRRRMVLF